MPDFIRYLFPPENMDDDEKRSIASTLQTIVFVSLIGVLMSLFFPTGYNISTAYRIIMGLIFILLSASLILLKRSIFWPAQILTPFAFFAIVTYLILTGNGLHDVTYFAYSLVIIVASMTLGQSAPFVFAGLIIATSIGIGLAEMNGILKSPASTFTSYYTLIIVSILVLAVTSTQRTLINRLNVGMRRARKNEKDQIKANQELRDFQSSLENQMEERTAELYARNDELNNANKQIQRRAVLFEALTQVTQKIISVRDLQELLPQITTLISEKFGFYHVGVFLLDEVNEYAVLCAANSAGGKKMLERRHRLRVGEEGIVGNVTATGEPRIAMDVGREPVYFNNPDLPDTHSEMALPLRSGKRIVGALDVQSIKEAAFTAEDVQMLSLLADQVSLAIENARLFDETRRALAESEAISRQSIRKAYGSLSIEQNMVGYKYNLTGSSPLENLGELMESEGDKYEVDQRETRQVVVPIELRGETIGTLVVQSPPATELNQDQLDLIKAVAERVALSAENARLFEETTRRAEREKLVSEITGKIRRENDPQLMIQTAMEELRNALGASSVDIIPQIVKGNE